MAENLGNNFNLSNLSSSIPTFIQNGSNKNEAFKWLAEYVPKFENKIIELMEKLIEENDGVAKR